MSVYIESVEILDTTADVYDLHVEHDHSFIVAGVVVHNSDICISHDGKRWPLDSDEIERPPLHVNCRSHLRPIIDWKGLGIEPPPESTRASAGGQVPASTRYDDWLRDQSVEEQNKILGPGRAQLFRAGKLNLRDLVRTDNSRVPLDELKRMAA